MRGPRYAAWAGMFVFGIAIALLGAAMPLLSSRAHFDLAQTGFLFFNLNSAVAVCALALGPYVDRHGTKAALISGPVLVAAALLIISVTSSFGVLLAVSWVLGMGGGLANISTNTLMASLYSDPRTKNAELNRLGVFFGLGALLVPLGLGSLLGRWGLEFVLWLVAAICLGAGLIAVPLRFSGPVASVTRPGGRNPARIRLDAWVLAAALLLFLQSGNEMILSGYATSHFIRFTDMASAAWAMTGMWAAVIVVRAALASLARRWSGYAIVLCSAALTVGGTLWLLVATTFLPAAASLALTGAAMAGIFPTMMGIAGARFADRPGAVFGVILAVARTGGMLMPWLAGVMSARWGTRAAIALALAGAGGILLLALRMREAGPAPARVSA